jgi:hypothetical protein
LQAFLVSDSVLTAQKPQLAYVYFAVAKLPNQAVAKLPNQDELRRISQVTAVSSFFFLLACSGHATAAPVGPKRSPTASPTPISSPKRR